MNGHPFITSVRMPGHFASQADVDRFQAMYGGAAADRRLGPTQATAPARRGPPTLAKPDAVASMLASMDRELFRARLKPALSQASSRTTT